jgi:signal transduction histidine kinase/HAMP domain-containing protein
MTLRTKLFLAQLPLVVALFFLGTLSIVTTSRIGDSSQTILKDNYRSVLAVQKMKESLERMDSAAFFVIEGRRREAEDIFLDHRSRFETELALQKGNITEKGEIEATRQLDDSWRQYRAKQDEFLALHGSAKEKTLYFKELYPQFQSIKTAADRILAMNQDAMVLKSDRVHRKAKNMNVVLITLSLFFIAVAVIVSTLLTAWIVRPLAVLGHTARQIEKGDLAVKARVRGSDEIASLANDFNKMAESLAKYRRSSLGELLLAQQASQATIDSFDDPVFVFGAGGDLLMVNRAAEEVFSTSFSTRKKDLFEGIPPVVGASVGRVSNHIFSGKRRYGPRGLEESFPVATSRGNLTYLVSGAPVYEMEGAVTGAVIVLQDVTRLARLSEFGQDLVAKVAHELRTPLTSLRMAIHICLERGLGDLNEKQFDLLYAAREDCERLQTMVDELLDISKINAGKIRIEPIPVDSGQLLQSVRNQYGNLGRESSIQLIVSDLARGDMVLADPEKITIVLTNLVINAIHHTAQGGTIEIRSLPETDAVRFEIMDTGKGISEEDLPHIFDRFFRGPDSPSGGVGLGLSIVKDIVTAHGGEVGAHSVEGAGTTLWFTLPRYRPGSDVVSSENG